MSDHCLFRQIRGYLGVENKLIMNEQRLFSTKRLPMSDCRVFSCEYRLCIQQWIQSRNRLWLFLS